VALIAALLGGFRAALLTLALVLVCVFHFERLWRTRYALILLAGCGLFLAGAFLFAQRLPFAVQRTLSVLPINVGSYVRQSAVGSTEWRLDMWREVLPTIPRYLIKGKGYALTADELFETGQAGLNGFGVAGAVSAVAGDYHSGPLSVIIPFG